MKRLLIPTLLLTTIYANEYSFVPSTQAYHSTNSYFNSLGMPNVSVGSRCPKKGDCWPVVEDQNGKVLRSYGTNHSVGTVSTGRYQNIAYLYYYDSYKSGKKTITNYYMLDQNGNSYDTPRGSRGFDSIITHNRQLLSVGAQGVYKAGTLISASKINLTHGRINN